MSAPTLTVFDLEYTAWSGSMAGHWLEPGQFKEVVQIGAVKLDGCDLSVLDELDLLVKPRINPVLSPYFENLTGISNDAVAARGLDFREAYGRFAAFVEGGPICAFGHDEWILEENLRLYGISDHPRLPPFTDLRRWFAACNVDPRGRHSCDLAPALGLKLVGRAHNALDDAKVLAAGAREMVRRGAVRPAA
ncbi:MAG: exonuclease domain-containing protein [Alphaproteobacteria bacterium]|nr:exonuclease domain-containing protein [Alphaproteobacteria bacterium]